MAIRKSDAVNSGLMPDFARAGVVLCRTGTYTVPGGDTKTFCTGTIQLVPVPNGAMILDWKLYYSVAIAGITQCDLGMGDDHDYFMADFNMQTADVLTFNTDGVVARGAGSIMTKDDTIDVTIAKLPTKLVTDTVIVLHVFYKMTGVIDDEG